MRRALALAERGRGTASPNPLVGCVIVQPGKPGAGTKSGANTHSGSGAVVGEGWHERAGEPHAEANALAAAGERARGATAYVTLEPCNHHGRTPPCAAALIAAGVARVVYAVSDPNPVAAGGGDTLRAAGIAVTAGVLRGEAEAQNRAWLTVSRLGRPFVLYKTAMTLDGKIATQAGDSRWVTGAAARERVHRWRGELDGIVVGIGTVLKDDPQLTARAAGADGKLPRSPVKIVFDTHARTPVSARLFEPDAAGNPARTVIVVGAEAVEGARDRVAALASRGADILAVPLADGTAGAGARDLLAARAGTQDAPAAQPGQGTPDVMAALRNLAQRGLTGLLLEGGGTLAWSFLRAGAIDRAAWFVAPKLVGGHAATPLAGEGVAHMNDATLIEDMEIERIGDDWLFSGRVAGRGGNH